MYILRNAIRSIVRSPGRTVIICLIVLVISTACCVSLSIQQSAQTARVNSKDSLTVRGHIKADRKYVMETLQSAQPSAESKEDAASSNTDSGEDEETATTKSGLTSDVKETLKGLTGLELDELLQYAELPSVRSFYYYGTVALAGDNGLTAMNADDHSDLENAISSAIPGGGQGGQQGGPGGGQGGPGGGQGGPGGGGGGNSVSVESIMAQLNFGGDFTLYGYSSDASMEDFTDGTCYMTAGQMFDEATTDYVCIINEDLASLNDLSVGDQIILANPGATTERFTFSIIGTYKNTSDTETTSSQAASDPANFILTSYPVVADIIARSESYHNPSTVESTKTLDDETVTEQLLSDDGMLTVKGQAEEDEEEYESDSALTLSVVGTYVFGTIEDYDAFEQQAKEAGLSDNYTVTSGDVAAYEASLVPLENLSTYANSFLYIVLGIGAVILIGVNVFNIRERKYEIGALTAMGMRKGKVAVQFVLELTIVTFLGIALGSVLGSVASTPVANALLASQIEYEQSNTSKVNENFGREAEGSAKPHGGDVEGEVTYVSTVHYQFDQVIVYKMAAIGAILALVSSAAAITFVLRYNPLEILAERD